MRFSFMGGLLAIGLVTAIWGFSNVVIRLAEMAVSPGILLLLRFLISSIVLLPILLRSALHVRDWLFGLSVGALLGLSVYFQGVAMQTVSVDQVAFISALYVVFVPLAMAILGRKWPRLALLVAVAMSLGGAALLIGHVSLGLKAGTLWSFAGAIGLTFQIIGTRSMTGKMGSATLAGVQSLGATIALSIVVGVSGAMQPALFHGLFHWSPVVYAQIAFLSLIATTLAVWLQGFGQAHISETAAALAFNTEPVWTALFALLILGQRLTVPQMIGAALIVSSLTFLVWVKSESP